MEFAGQIVIDMKIDGQICLTSLSLEIRRGVAIVVAFVWLDNWTRAEMFPLCSQVLAIVIFNTFYLYYSILPCCEIQTYRMKKNNNNK